MRCSSSSYEWVWTGMVVVGWRNSGVVVCRSSLAPCFGAKASPTISERQTVGVVVGGMLPVRLMDGQSSRLNGVSVHPYWQIEVSNPIGDG